MLRPLLLSIAALLVSASTAFAGSSNLSGTVTTSVPANFADTSASNAANATGPNDGLFLTIVNAVSGTTGTWTINGGIGTTGIEPKIALTFWSRSPNVSNYTAVLNRVQFIDSNGNTATFDNSGAGIGFSVLPTANSTIQSFTYNSLLQNYTLAGSFVAANVVSISFDIAFTTNGNNKAFQFDALDIVTTPEPATFGLFAVGALGLGCLVRRRARIRAARKPADV